MRLRWAGVAAAGAAVLLGAGPLAVPGAAGAAAGAVRAAGSWGRAIEVPGLGALDKGGNAKVSSVSCASAGNCAAGGFYRDGSGLYQGFVVSERNGRWGQAIEVPGLGGLNKGGLQFAGVGSVSCASPGNCAADGSYYTDTTGHQQAFVVSQKNGRWGNALTVPGLGILNKGGNAEVTSVSCAAAGSCVAGGNYQVPGRLAFQAFVTQDGPRTR